MEEGEERTASTHTHTAQKYAHTRQHSLQYNSRIRFVSQDNEFGGGGKGPDSEGGTQRYGGIGAYGEWAVDEDAKNFETIKTWNGPHGVWL